MNAIVNKFAALGEKAVALGTDMTVAKTGGGDYVPPAAGPCQLRFVSYVEVGKHEKTFKGVPKTENVAFLTFEVLGKNYPPVVVDGVLTPVRIQLEVNVSLNEKANFFKLFQRMNHEGKAKHIVQLLGEGYKGKIVHRKYMRKDNTEGVAVDLKDETGYTIAPPFYDEIVDGEPTGQVVRMNIPAPVSQLKAFVWDLADMDQWASIYIDGQYPERKNAAGQVTAPAKSKNVFQNKIKLAKNFVGSPIHQLLIAGGQPLDIPDAEAGKNPETEGQDAAPPAPPALSKVPVGAAADDALAGVV